MPWPAAAGLQPWNLLLFKLALQVASDTQRLVVRSQLGLQDSECVKVMEWLGILGLFGFSFDIFSKCASTVTIIFKVIKS
jgi:hypothetical protein